MISTVEDKTPIAILTEQ